MNCYFMANVPKSDHIAGWAWTSCIFRALLVLLCAITLDACSDGSDSHPDIGYSALIERTQYGTAHITADSYGSLGFGQGYAIAQDRFCVLADQIVKVRSERARYFGAGKNGENIQSDLAYLALGVMEKAPNMIASVSQDGQSLLRGYVAGFNKYLSDRGVSNLPKDCAGKDWVKPIDAESLMAYHLDLTMLHGSRGWLSGIANARPPAMQDAVGFSPITERILPSDVGSNVVAVGAEMTGSGHGLLLSNTHLPWEGELQYHEMHLTIPGEIDVAGVSLSGLVGVVNGFNQSVAWSHTDSTANQYAIYSLDLVPGQPTRYRYGSEELDMEARTYTVSVLQPDGSLEDQSHVLYRSRYGPMLIPGFGLTWTNEQAYSIFDTNAENGTLIDTIISIAKAESVTELREILGAVGSLPNNILATDSRGQTFYADVTKVPKLGETAEQAFRDMIESDQASDSKNLFLLPFSLGFVLLDGSNPLFTVERDNTATVPGMIPLSGAPQLFRRDFVANSNDSYWISNPAEPLVGYSLRYGEIETPRKLRTRMGLTQILESSIWTSSMLKDMLFANRSYTEELWRDSFVDYCSRFSNATSSDGQLVNIEAACTTLSNWDGSFNINSQGAVLYREIMSSVDLQGRFGGKSFYSQELDIGRPVATPSGLTNEGESYFLTQLANAILRLQKANIPVDAFLGDYQYSLNGGEKIGIHGGHSRIDGAFNAVDYSGSYSENSTLLPRLSPGTVINPQSGLTAEGYLRNSGASFVATVEFTDDGPVADVILTYSQSDDPESPHFNDQISLYSSKTWRPLPFTREQIESDPKLTTMTVND